MKEKYLVVLGHIIAALRSFYWVLFLGYVYFSGYMSARRQNWFKGEVIVPSRTTLSVDHWFECVSIALNVIASKSHTGRANPPSISPNAPHSLHSNFLNITIFYHSFLSHAVHYGPVTVLYVNFRCDILELMMEISSKWKLFSRGFAQTKHYRPGQFVTV